MDTPVASVETLISSQVRYYRARASKYDLLYSERMHQSEVSAHLEHMPIGADILELACGTGQWSNLIAHRARAMTLVDASPEMLAIARTRLAGLRVEFIEANLFDWSPRRTYDTVFIAFWLSHVPATRFEAFWSMIRAALTPGGSVVFLDDSPKKAEVEEFVAGNPEAVARRCLQDGSEHLVVKVLYHPDVLQQRLIDLGWAASVRSLDDYYLAGVASL